MNSQITAATSETIWWLRNENDEPVTSWMEKANAAAPSVNRPHEAPTSAAKATSRLTAPA